MSTQDAPMDFDTWIGDAWNRHGDDPAAIAAGFVPDGLVRVGNAGQLARLASLAHHVLGEHLGRWDDGMALLQQWRAHPQNQPGGESDAALDLYLASLGLCAGVADPAATLRALTPTDAVRAQALAAGNLALHDTARALALFEAALAQAEGSALPERGPHLRTLAITGNNLACTLEERPQRSETERELMIAAALAARRYWALAGGWLETERAEYRLAQTWLKAGEPQTAREHALKCLEIVEANGAVPLERFFGWEALALAERAAGDDHARTQALERAREAFAALQDSDRGWCQASLDKLEAA